MPKDVLTAEKLSKTYQKGDRKITAFTDVTLTMKPREFVCVLGPNGCGKSSFLKVIAGVMPATSGSLVVTDKITYLPQQPSLLPWRTAVDNLLLPTDIQGGTTAASKATARQVLKSFGLSEFANYYPSALSGGMQQKVALLRSVILKPELLLLDEPFAALDAITRATLQTWLLDLWQQQNNSVLCVTHDIREAIFLADTIIVFSERPGHIKLQTAVDLPRPRLQRHLSSPQAIRLERRLQRLLMP
jgi:ABC-type nitrate/sulfonate/bicarbonate transport system ATPase subunit